MAQKNILTNFTVVAGVEGQNTLQSLAKQLDGLSFSAKKLSKDLQASSGATGIQQITKDSENAKRSVGGLAAALDDYRVKIVAAGFAAQQFVKTLVSILEVQGRIDQLEVGLNLVNDGNTRKIADDLEFLKDTTNRLGLEFTQTSVLYTKFAAAAKETGFSASQTREVFDSFAGATARLSLSADSANRVFFALQQIVSKGTVSSEELKNQLGEKIPGVMAIAAKAFDGGKGDIEAFNKALADGKVQVDDFLIPFAEGIRESLGVASGESVNTATAAFGRFKNSYDDLLRAVVDSGLGDAVVRLFDGATDSIGGASEAIRDLKADTQAFFDSIDFEALQLLAEVFVGIKGASVGAATGAAIGSVVPGIGTAVGAAVGAGVGYLGGAAATNEVINQARFGKQEAFNELLERQAEIEQKIIEVTNRRDSAYGKNFLNQKALTEEIQALQMEGLQIDLDLMNSNKELSESVVQYGKEINKTFQEAEDLQKAEQRAAKAADKRKDQLKGLTEELDGVNKKYVEGKKVLDASLAAGDIDEAQYRRRLKQLADSTAKKGKENTTYKSFIKSLDEQNTKFKEELGLIQKRTETDKLRERALEATKGKIDAVTEAKLKENAALEASLKLQNELKEIRKQEADFAQDLKISARQEADEIANRNKQIEDEIARIGLKTEALAELEAQALLTRAAQAREAAEDVGGFNPTLYAERIRQAEELEKQVALVRKKAEIEAAIERAEEQKKANQEIVDDFVDLFKNVSTQSGKQFADDLKRAVEIKFQSFVIRVGVEAALNTAVGSAITGFNTQGGGLSGILQSAGAFANLGAASNTMANAAVFASAKLAEFAGLSSAATGSLTSFAASAGAAVPYIGAAVAAFGVINSLRSKKISAQSLGAEFNQSLIDSLQKGYTEAARSLGGAAAQVQFGAGGNTGRQGQNANFSLNAVANGRDIFSTGQTADGQADGLFLRGEIALNDKNIAEQTTRAIVAALKLSDFADNIDAVIQSLDPLNGELDALNAGLANAQLLAGINNLTETAGAMATLSGASIETVQSLVALTGGIEGLAAKQAAFYDAFTSDAKKTEDLTKTVTDAFAKFNMAVPDTREGLSELVNGLNLQDEAQQALYATILDLTPALDKLLPAFEEITQAAEAAQAAIASERLAKIQANRKAEQALVDAENNLFESLTQSFKGLNAEATTLEAAVSNLGLSVSEFNQNSALAAFVIDASAQIANLKDMGASTERVSGLLLKATNQLSQAIVSSRLLAGDFGSAFSEAFSNLLKNDRNLLVASLNPQYRSNVRSVAEAEIATARVLSGELSKNALRVVNVAGALGAAMAQVQRSINTIVEVDAANLIESFGEAGKVLSNTLTGFIQEGARRAFATPYSQGVQGIIAAREQIANGMRQFDRNAIVNTANAQIREIKNLSDGFRLGNIAAEEFDSALSFLNENFGTTEQSAGQLIVKLEELIQYQYDNAEQIDAMSVEYARQQAATTLLNAGLNSSSYYFGEISKAVNEFNQVASEVAQPLDLITDSIGRMNSAAYVFEESAKAIREGLQAAAELSQTFFYKPYSDASGTGTMFDARLINAEAVSEAAALLANTITSRTANEAAKAIVKLPSFGPSQIVGEDQIQKVRELATALSSAIAYAPQSQMDLERANQARANLVGFISALEVGSDRLAGIRDLLLSEFSQKGFYADSFQLVNFVTEVAKAQGQSIRDVSLLLQDASEFSNEGLERTFYRLSDALNNGMISVEQYTDLIAYSREIYLGVAKSAEVAQAEEIRARQEAIKSLQASSESFLGFASNIRRLREEITLSTSSATQLTDVSKSQFDQVVSAVRDGDSSRIQDLSGAANSFLDAARASSSSYVEFIKQVAFVQSELASLEGSFMSQYELDMEALDTANEQLRQLQILNEQTLEVAQGIGNLQSVFANISSNVSSNVSSNLVSVPGFAGGGTFGGGLRIVGENGPELEATGPSRIISNSRLQAMMQGGSNNDAMVSELRALRREVAQLREANSAENRAIAGHTAKAKEILVRGTDNGTKDFAGNEI